MEALVSSMFMVKAWGGKVVLADIPGPISDLPQFKNGLMGFEIYGTETLYPVRKQVTPLNTCLRVIRFANYIRNMQE